MDMRIDIVRRDIESIYNKIRKLHTGNKNEIEGLYAKFLHVLINDPITKTFIIGLSNFKDDVLNSTEFDENAKIIRSSINSAVTEIEKSHLAQGGLVFTNNFYLKDDNGQIKLNLTFVEFVGCLKNIDEYIKSSSVLIDLDGIIVEVSRIFCDAQKRGVKFDIIMINNAMEDLRECKGRLHAYLSLRAEMIGATALLRLLPCYLVSEYKYLSGLNQEEFNLLSNNANQDVNRYLLMRSGNTYATLEDVESLFFAVDKFLSTSISKHALIARLITYCRWIKRDEFKEIKKEAEISKIAEEFIFNHGYFPITKFNMGKSQPDIMAMSRWDNSVLIELKQTIGKSYTDKKLATDIGQAKDYLSDVRGINPDITDAVYLLVFYDGDTRLSIDKPDKIPGVHVEFVYIGEKSPSQLKKSKVLGKN